MRTLFPVALLLALVALLSGCAQGPVTSPTASPASTRSPAPATSPAPTTVAPPSREPAPSNPTPVPGGVESGPVPGSGATTETDWGTILDTLPATFPRFTGAKPADADGPVSGAFTTP